MLAHQSVAQASEQHPGERAVPWRESGALAVETSLEHEGAALTQKGGAYAASDRPHSEHRTKTRAPLLLWGADPMQTVTQQREHCSQK
ncbi:hypothetical protein GCM10010365_65790 [Streptomyces poonensis]|uniref:Uncharacterized protein n=1 Tax=Streptomyces poonensis TaxID=68255 RepID=A0A918Q6L9_9ACTN|nr:hypothetical protein GCM10010365_65790 [Streptomyces poonensis]GLJ89640.1 hypothetical protein GCM10017589_22400 [Streptomyces poonensis]